VGNRRTNRAAGGAANGGGRGTRARARRARARISRRSRPGGARTGRTSRWEVAAAAVVGVALAAGAAVNKGDAAAVAALNAAAAADVVNFSNFFFVYYKWDIYTINVGDASAVVRALKVLVHWPNLPLILKHIKLIKKNIVVENNKTNQEHFQWVIRLDPIHR
jgi:hypothetical protein